MQQAKAAGFKRGVQAQFVTAYPDSATKWTDQVGKSKHQVKTIGQRAREEFKQEDKEQKENVSPKKNKKGKSKGKNKDKNKDKNDAPEKQKDKDNDDEQKTKPKPVNKSASQSLLAINPPIGSYKIPIKQNVTNLFLKPTSDVIVMRICVFFSLSV